MGGMPKKGVKFRMGWKDKINGLEERWGGDWGKGCF